MTTADLDRLSELLKAATPGEWGFLPSSPATWKDAGVTAEGGGWIAASDNHNGPAITALHNAAPDLIALAREALTLRWSRMRELTGEEGSAIINAVAQSAVAELKKRGEAELRETIAFFRRSEVVYQQMCGDFRRRAEAAEAQLAEAKARLDTETEVREAQERSTFNLAEYALDDSKYLLPMRGNDIVTRDAIKALRAELKTSKPH